jgi:quercetin dioxygenase-like cupin family protein
MLIDHTREGRQERLNPDRLHTFELGATARELLEQAHADENGRAGTLLVRTPELRVVLQTLRESAVLAEHHAPGPITVQVLQGELRFSAEDQVVCLRVGELLALPAGRPHAVEAVRDSAFLLTIGPSR